MRFHLTLPVALALVCLPLAACATQTGEDVAKSPSAVVACASGSTLEGIDVSSWQGTIDWSRVAGAGIQFAFIRVSDGAYQDPKFDQNWSGARANGVIRGVYQFFRAHEDPVAQADLLISRMGPLQPDDLAPVLDAEVTDGQSTSTIATKIGQWVDRIETRTGRTPIIYTGRYFWNDSVGRDMSDLPLWIANLERVLPQHADGVERLELLAVHGLGLDPRHLG